MRFLRFFLFLVLIFPYLAFAQTPDFSGLQSGNATSIVLNPANPGPNETVKATLESYDINLDTASITWYVDGTVVKSGIGIKSIDINSGNTGTSKTIRVSANGNGKNINKSATIGVGDIDFLWQGRGYVPPFYKGRTLWVNQGFLTLVAIPHVFSQGSEINSRNLIYRWSINNEILGADSGRGRNSLTFQDSILGIPKTVKLEVLNGENLAAEKSITFRPQLPRVFVYENNPLYGFMFNYEASAGFMLKKNEVSFAAFPYFFTALNRGDSTLDYKWSTNKTSNLEKNNEIIFRIPDNAVGTAYVKADVKSTTQMLQGATRDFLIDFENKNEL